ncbi:MAG: outer membrane protein OmpA-like peptidoglycan-associated protein [Parvicella sp.]|jgi:outer membrane protein OmpA-like peptidoglycan-associated protein
MKKDSNFFWIGYSDLLTSLFFVMLVLFVVSVGYLEAERRATENQLKKIEELNASVENLPEQYFQYQPEFKRFKLIREIQFSSGSAVITEGYHSYLKEVGRSIVALVDSLQSSQKFNEFDIKYLIVIEGMASKDNYAENFELSYKRALSLYRFWIANDILFNSEICEIQIAGSGTDGVREYSGRDERKNQQFLIHIVPKIGKI